MGFSVLAVASQTAFAFAPATSALESQIATQANQSTRAEHENLASTPKLKVSIPRPGQRVMRIQPMVQTRESMSGPTSGFANGHALEVVLDAVSKTPVLVSGILGLHLDDAFGGKEAFAKWSRGALRTKTSREQMARHLDSHIQSFVATHESELGFSQRQLVLNTDKFFADAENTLIAYDVVLGKSRLKGASVNFRFSEGQLVQVSSRTFGANKDTVLPTGTLPSHAVVSQTVRSVLGAQSTVVGGSVNLVLVPRVVETEGVKNYAFVPAFEVQGAAVSGEKFAIVADLLSVQTAPQILEWYSTNLFVTAQISGVVNTRSVGGPQATHGLPYINALTANGGWGNPGKTVTADKSGKLTLPSVTEKPLTVTLSSPRFKISNKSGSNASLQTTGDATFTPGTNATLAETTTFYHLTVAHDWAREIVNPDWFKSQVGANVNISDACNAYFDGSRMHFFNAGAITKNGKVNKCANTGEIADVVYHEWGHGLDANTGGIDDRAFSEGIGDIVSALLTDSPVVGPGFFADGKPVRNLDSDYMYPPKDDETEVHREGLIIGSTYYHLTQALQAKYGKDVGLATAKKWFLKVIYTADQYTEVYDALLALDAGSGNPKSGPNFCLVNKAFARHGLAKSDVSCN